MVVTTEFISPVGRLVQGDVMTPRTTDRLGNPLTIKNGPNKGQATQNFFVAVAFAKDHPEWPAFYAKIYDCARQNFPQLFDPTTGACKHPNFAMKIVDGDGVDDDGKPNAEKAGFAGHWIVKFSSQFAIRPLSQEGQLIADPAIASQTLKRGHFVRVIGSAKGNEGAGGKPGLYISPGAVQFCGYGKEISSGPDFASLAAAAGPAAYVPPGMSAVPLAGAAPSLGMPTPPGAVPMPGLPTPPGAVPMPGLPTPPGAVPSPPAAVAAPVYTMTPAAQGYTREQYLSQGYTDEMLIAQGLMTKTAPAPNPGFVAGAVAAAGMPMPPAPAALPMPPAPPAGPTMTAKANGATREALHVIGWTDATLIANGMMLP